MSIEFTKRYSSLISKAAVMANYEGIEQIERRHLFSAICIMSPQMFNRLLGRKQLVYPSSIDFDRVLNTYKGKPTFSVEAYRVLTLNGGCLGEVMESLGMVPIDIQHVAAALLFDSDEHGPVKEMLLANGIDPLAEKQSILEAVKGMCRSRSNKNVKDALSKVDTVRKALQKTLIGQDSVIEQICASLLEYWSEPSGEHSRPLSIFIAGVSGSGKTLLADTLITSIAKLTGTKRIEPLNSGMFSSVDTARDIVGLDHAWKAPKPGVYTLPILDNPEGVICLDHIENLHPIALSHVLRAITTGWLKDEYLAKQIDFRQSICIFITSAGGEYVSDATAAGMGTSSSRKRLVEELCSGIKSSEAQWNVRALAEQSSLAVVMKPLGVSEMRTLMASTVRRECQKIGKSVKRVFIDYEGVADLLVQSIESLDPRGAFSIVGQVLAPLRNLMLNSSTLWHGLKELNVILDGAEPLDLQRVSDNLHMRKRMTVNSSVAVQGKTATLRIQSAGYVMLPAITDGLISVNPPSSTDTFKNLVGISAPLAYVNRWIRYFAGESDIRPEHLILSGPPGCGKTSFVRALALDIQKPYVILNCNDLCSPHAILDAFRTIRKYAHDGLLVFLDELDSVGGARDGKSEGYIERLNILLQQIDGFSQDSSSKVLYIAATNRIASLDDALLRSGRFGQTIAFSPLNEKELHELVKLAAREFKVAIDQDLENIIVETSEGVTPATIKATIREMSFSSENSHSSKEEYLNARQTVVEGVYTQHATLSDEEAYAVASHEAGHALCADMNNRHFIQVSVMSGGDKLGFLEQRHTGLLSRTKKGFLSSIDILLAGRAAQEILLGQPTDGAINDIQKATYTAQQYVMSGFSEYGLGIPSDGLEWIEISPIVRKLLDTRYIYVKQQLSKEKRVLLELTKLLLQKKTVFQDEVKGLRKEAHNREKDRSTDHE